MEVVAIVVLALAAVGLALRNSGLKTEKLEAEAGRQTAEAQLQQTSREFMRYRQAAREQLAAIREDVRELEIDLDECTSPGMRRNRLERLLSKAADRDNPHRDEKLLRAGRPSTDNS